MAQSQVNIQAQEQQLRQQQHLTKVQLQTVKLLEMPIAQLEDCIRQEIDDNPSIEPDYTHTEEYLNTAADSTDSESDIVYTDEEERQRDAIEEAFERIGEDDRMGDNDSLQQGYELRYTESEGRQIEHGNETSFIETLIEQMNMEELTEQEKTIMEYLIGSLDDDGLLRKDLGVIADELSVHYYILLEPEDIEKVLKKLQEFDPAGTGARSLQECLLIQIERMKATSLTMFMYRVINECFDDFKNNRWAKIQKTLSLTDSQAEELRSEIRHRLNPKPGASMGEVQGRALNQITPDIILHIDQEENISFEQNNGRIPQLHIVKEDEEFIRQFSKDKASHSEKEGLAFTQHYVERANIFIEAMQQRMISIDSTMKAIIRMQRSYLLSGDESELKPMVLKDVADMTGLDISTVSRVSRAKYIQTPFGIFPLKHFFNEGYTTTDGNTMSTRKIKTVLKDTINGEDSSSPYSDDALVAVMKQKGYPIARRTIAKYREQMGIPIARLRRK